MNSSIPGASPADTNEVASPHSRSRRSARASSSVAAIARRVVPAVGGERDGGVLVGSPAVDVSEGLALALELAEIADTVTTARFRAADLVVETKPDLTPVSEADRDAEQAIRKNVARERPNDVVLGEEYGTTGTGPRRWIVDPIDGTKNFVRGQPVWATLIALQVDDEITVGVVSAPALARRWWCSRGGGAWTRTVDGDELACTVSGVRELSDAFLSYSGLGGWGDREDGFRHLARAVWRNRGFGDFWSYALVAEGAVDIAC